MSYKPELHHRKSIRLKGNDYSQFGVYFVTINIREKNISHDFLGKIVNDMVILNDVGKIVSNVWFEIPNHFEGVELDEFIIMPDHVHGLIIINELENQSKNMEKQEPKTRGVVSEELALKKRSLGSIVGSFKSEVSRRVNRKHKLEGGSIWQRNFYERIVRNEKELDMVRSYIENNPINWYN